MTQTGELNPRTNPPQPSEAPTVPPPPPPDSEDELALSDADIDENVTLAILREVIDDSDSDEELFLNSMSRTNLEQLRFFTRVGLAPQNANEICGVCQEPIQEFDIYRELRCHHVFHIGCVDRALETSSICPLCRTTISTDNPVTFDAQPTCFRSSDAERSH